MSTSGRARGMYPGLSSATTLSNRRSAILELSRRGCQVEVLREKVEAVEAANDVVVLHTWHGTRRDVDYVVLCVGSGPPADTYGLADSPNFVAEPYPVRRSIAAIDPDHNIAVVG